MESIHSPVFVFEGDGGNFSSLQAMQRACKNPMVHFYPVPRADHFNVLAPAHAALARKVMADTGPETNITFTDAELGGLMPR